VTGRPHAGAGGAKAAADAWALAERLLEADGDVDRALQVWEPEQLERGYALLAKVRHMGRVLQSGAGFAPGDAAFRWGLPAVAEPDAPRRGTVRVAGVGSGLVDGASRS
jgi:2,6-dihydroxypyridine 3-monooxygenase